MKKITKIITGTASLGAIASVPIATSASCGYSKIIKIHQMRYEDAQSNIIPYLKNVGDKIRISVSISPADLPDGIELRDILEAEVQQNTFLSAEPIISSIDTCLACFTWTLEQPYFSSGTKYIKVTFTSSELVGAITSASIKIKGNQDAPR